MRQGLFFILMFLTFVCHSSDEDTSCTTDSDCPIYNICTNEKCVRKELFPMASGEIAGSCLLVLVATIAISGGIGGSAICTSLLLSLFRFLPHQAVALTQCFLFSGTSTAVAMKIRDRHPNKDRPIIYYDFLLQLSCPLVLGVSIGVFINPAFPGWLILTLLVTVILIVITLTFRNGILIFKQEQIKRREQQLELKMKSEEIITNDQKDSKSKLYSDEKESDSINQGDSDSQRNIRQDHKESEQQESKSFVQSNNDEVGNEDSIKNEIINEDNIAINTEEIETNENGKKVQPIKGSKNILSEEEYIKYKNLPEKLKRSITSIREIEKKTISIFHILFFLLMAGLGMCFTLFRGTQNYKSVVGIEKCSGGFFALLATYIILMLSISFSISIYLIKKNKVCEASGYDFEMGDIRWSSKTCSFFIGMGVLIGTLVGIIGDGGFIVSPILLHLKIDPQISTVSSLFTIMITSLSALIQFYIAGVINWKYSLFLIACAHIGSLIAILVVRKYFLKIGRKSFLVFALVCIFFCSLCIIPTFGIINLTNQQKDGTFQLGFQSLC